MKRSVALVYCLASVSLFAGNIDSSKKLVEMSLIEWSALTAEMGVTREFKGLCQQFIAFAAAQDKSIDCPSAITTCESDQLLNSYILKAKEEIMPDCRLTQNDLQLVWQKLMDAKSGFKKITCSSSWEDTLHWFESLAKLDVFETDPTIAEASRCKLAQINLN